MIKFKNFKKRNSKTILHLGGAFLLLTLVFVLSQIALAKNGNGSFQIKTSYVEVQKTDYPKYISLVKKENGKEEVTGQVKIVDQYLISDLPENEFLEEYSNLKLGFQDLSISLEADEPLFNKENFYHPPSLFEKTKSFFGFATLPEYRITKEIDKSASVRTELDLRKLKIETHYQQSAIRNQQLAIKQTLTFINNSGQDLNLSLLLKNQIGADKIYWNNQEYVIAKIPLKFVNPDRVSFNIKNGKAFYDFSDVPEEFEPELWIEKKDGKNLLILSLTVSLSTGETKTIDPTYGVELTILNVHSQPQAGDYWTVSFETEGTADLTITPDDQATIDDLDFVSLTCDGEEKIEAGPLTILEGDVIFYPNWQCDGIGEVTHLVNVARKHTLKFQFGDQTAYAYNDPGSVTDTFSDDSKVSTTSNVVVSGGVARLSDSCPDTLVDSRDSKTYATVLIGSQCWMAQGLNVGTMITGVDEPDDDGVIEKYCYGDTEANCDSTDHPNYPDGGMYQWAEALDLSYSCSSTVCSGQVQSPHQGICPAGWHIPTDAEWHTLEKVYWTEGLCEPGRVASGQCAPSGDALAPGGESGFEGNLGGYRFPGGNFDDSGSTGAWWSALEYSAIDSWLRSIYGPGDDVTRTRIGKDYGLQIRCIKD